MVGTLGNWAGVEPAATWSSGVVSVVVSFPRDEAVVSVEVAGGGKKCLFVERERYIYILVRGREEDVFKKREMKSGMKRGVLTEGHGYKRVHPSLQR